MPVALGPLETIINVSWGAGVFIQVKADSLYDHGEPGTRKGILSLSADAAKAGAVILAEKVFQEPGDPEAHTAPTMKFVGVMRFPRMPKNETEAFRLKLSGATTYEDEQHPQPSESEFCGTTTSTWSYTRFIVYFQHATGTQPFVWETVHASFTSPAGSGSFESTYELANVTLDDVNNPPPTHSASSDSIWYRDKFGNYIDTHRPCSELAPPGDPPVPATHTEGFKGIEVSIFPQQLYKMIPLNKWTTGDGDKVEPAPVRPAPGKPAPPEPFGGPIWKCVINPYKIGLNADFLPIYEDLPNGDYSFRVGRFTFLKMPPPRQGVPFTSIGTYPTAPAVAAYDFAVGTTKPYQEHWKLPASPEVIVAGKAPDPQQAFDL